MNDLPPDKKQLKMNSYAEKMDGAVKRRAFGISLFALCCLLVSTTASLVWSVLLCVRHDRTLEFKFIVAVTVLQLLNIILHVSLLKYKSRELYHVACVATVGIILYLVIFIIFHFLNEVPDKHLFKIIPIAAFIAFVHFLLIAANVNALRMIDENKGKWKETEVIENVPAGPSESSDSIWGLKNVNFTSFTHTGMGKDELTLGSSAITPQAYIMKNPRHIARRVLKFSSTIIENREPVSKDLPSNTIAGTETNISEYPNELNPFEKNEYPERDNPFNDQYSEMPGSKSSDDLSSVFLSDVTSEAPDLSSESLAELHTTREVPEPRSLTPNATSTPKDGLRRSQQQMKYIEHV